MSVVALLASLIFKPALVVAAAMLFARVARRRSAAVRHAIWTGAIGAVLCLPLVAFVVPPLRLGGIQGAIVHALADQRQDASRVLVDSPAVNPPVAVLRSNDGSARTGPIRLDRVVLFAWMSIALLLVFRRLGAELLVRRIVHRGRPAPRLLDISSRVDVIVSDEVASPAVAGLLHATVVLPAPAEQWSAADLAVVMRHELAHIKRRDCAINLVADITAAIYWCNPLVYLAVRKLHTESERACDDHVLENGADSEGYAQLLLSMARVASMSGSLPRAATAMTRPSELESRVLAVLDPRVSRTAPRARTRVLLAASIVIVALPVAAATSSATPAQSSWQVRGPEPDLLRESVADQASERVPFEIDETVIAEHAQRALHGPDSTLAAQLLAAVTRVPDAPGSLVRHRAAWVLAAERGGQLVNPMLESLSAPDWRVQAYAAWVLGYAGDRRAVPRLLPLMHHDVWRLRAITAATLRMLADPRAEDAMVLALTDPAWQVRREAVEYVAAIGESARHRVELRARLNDRHIAVRDAASRALNAL